MSFLSRFGIKPKENADRVGIEINADGIYAAHVRRDTDGPAKLVNLSFEPSEGEEGLPNAFARLKSYRCPINAAMPIPSYQLLLVEAPDVPELELRAAVRWRIKDLIDFHIDDAVIDVFEMPEQSRGGQTKMMYAIAARSDVIRQQVDLIGQKGFTLDAIDIPELCLRNVASQLPEDPDGVAILHLADTQGFLSVTRQGLVYLTRRIETGVNALREANGLRAGLVEGLALEVRRSLDYFESHYDQKPVRKLYVTGIEDGEVNDLATDLSLDVKQLRLSDCVAVEGEFDGDLERRSLTAIGAALRDDVVSL